MSGICILSYCLLAMIGVQLFRMRVQYIWWLVVLLSVEVIYFFGVGESWLAPRVGVSIGAATGVANGGLMVQFFLLFPLWAPILAFWAKKRLYSAEESLTTG